MMDQKDQPYETFAVVAKSPKGIMHKFFSFVLLVGILIPISFSNAQLPNFFMEARKTILEQYINPRSIDLKKWDRELELAALQLCQPTCDEEKLNALLGGRVQLIGDSHFYLYDPTSLQPKNALEVSDFRHSTKFGFVIESFSERNVISYVHPGTPAAASLKVGDFLLSANFVSANFNFISQPVTITLSMAERHGKGVDIALERNGKRLVVRIYPNEESWISTSEVIEKSVLWLRLTTTDDKAQQLIYNSVRQAKTDGIKGIILDLRANMGGQPFKTINIAGAFVAKLGLALKNRSSQSIYYNYAAGKVIYANEVTGQREEEVIANAVRWEGPLVLLVSRRTFSGGENLANILQTSGRAKVIGELSRGGGGVTGNQFTLKNQITMFVPQYRHYDVSGIPRPLQVIPDQSLKVQDGSTLAAGDQWLAVALATLKLK